MSQDLPVPVDAAAFLPGLRARAAALWPKDPEERETHLRSLIKTVTYRIGGSTVTALLALTYTRKVSWALGIGGADAVAKLLLFYAHERLWNRIDYGRRAKAAAG